MNNSSAVYAAGVPLLDFDLSSEISALETSEKRQAGRNARTLMKNENFRVVLVSLSAGAHVREHRANTPISIQVLTGSVRFHAPEHTSVLPAGRLVVLDRGVLHDIEALEDSAFLLTFA